MNAQEVIAEALDAMPADPRPTQVVNHDRAQRSVDALSKAGFAIVRLPHMELRNGRTPAWPVASRDVEAAVVIRGDGKIADDGISNPHLDIKSVRSHAAALLAAAAWKEGGHNDIHENT